MAFSNESKNSTSSTYESKNSTVYSLGHSALLQEGGLGFLLKEDGSKLLIEPEKGPKDDADVTYSFESKNIS